MSQATAPQLDAQLETRLLAIKRAEHAASKRAALLVGVAVLAGATVVIGSFVGVANLRAKVEPLKVQRETLEAEVDAARAKLEETMAELARARDENASLRAELDRIQQKLTDAAAWEKWVHPMPQVMVDSKAMMGSSWGELLRDILDAKRQGVSFSLQGQDPKTGFHSPGFMGYMLNKSTMFRRRQNLPESATWQDALHALEARKKAENKPSAGDIVSYSSGYYMLYGVDHDGSPYVIGMTPFGIVPLKPDFAPITAVYSPW